MRKILISFFCRSSVCLVWEIRDSVLTKELKSCGNDKKMDRSDTREV